MATISHEMEERRIVVLYGSQTGTAQDVGERVGREAKRRHFKTRVLSMDSYAIVSTTINVKTASIYFVDDFGNAQCFAAGQNVEPNRHFFSLMTHNR